MKFLIWFVYLSIASGLMLLLSGASMATTVTGAASAAMFFTMAIYGGAIFFARLTCKWWSARSGHSPSSKKILHTEHSTGTTVPGRLPGEIVEVYRQPKKRTALSRPVGTIFVLISCAVFLLSIGFSAWSWWSAKSEYRTMAEEAQKSYESRIPAIRSAAYDDGYAAGIEDGRSSDASIQRRLANLRDAAELEFCRNNAVFVTVSGEKYHCYGCHHLTGHRYFIYNIELAKEMGYEPCSDCWGG